MAISAMDAERVLRNNLLFQEFSDEQCRKIIPLMRELTVDSGSFVIHQGELGHEFYIIRSGMVEVLKRTGNRDNMLRLATFQEGDNFGEIALLENGYRTASVRALKQTSLFVISINDISALNDVDIFSHLYKGLAQQLNSRLRFTNEAVAKVVGNDEIHAKAKFFVNSLITVAVVVLLIFSFIVGFMVGKGGEATASAGSGQEIIIR